MSITFELSSFGGVNIVVAAATGEANGNADGGGAGGAGRDDDGVTSVLCFVGSFGDCGVISSLGLRSCFDGFSVSLTFIFKLSSCCDEISACNFLRLPPDSLECFAFLRLRWKDGSGEDEVELFFFFF